MKVKKELENVSAKKVSKEDKWGSVSASSVALARKYINKNLEVNKEILAHKFLIGHKEDMIMEVALKIDELFENKNNMKQRELANIIARYAARVVAVRHGMGNKNIEVVRLDGETLGPVSTLERNF